MTSPRIAKLVVDANAILSATIGERAMQIFLSRCATDFAVTEAVLREVKEYVPILADRKGLNAGEMLAILALLPLTQHPKALYEAHLPQARNLIGARDPDDVETAALALALDSPIWTNDRDFEGLGFTIYTTAALLEIAAQR